MILIKTLNVIMDRKKNVGNVYSTLKLCIINIDIVTGYLIIWQFLYWTLSCL